MVNKLDETQVNHQPIPEDFIGLNLSSEICQLLFKIHIYFDKILQIYSLFIAFQ